TASALGPPIVTFTGINYASQQVWVDAQVDTQGALTTVYLEYGTNVTYGGGTILYGVFEPFPGAGPGRVRIFFPAPLYGFTYHARVVASNVYGTGDTGDQQITAPFVPPVIVSIYATQVTSNSATFNAVINPNGYLTAVAFNYLQ